ncbi:MAG: hypothetical protein KHX56_03565 [Clostridiales bacterium]|nr:hypothetical protein [Clostridiales bacterium]
MKKALTMKKEFINRKKWKKTGLNLSAVLLGGAVAAGSFVPALAANEIQADKVKDQPRDFGALENTESSEAKTVTKDETVYVKLAPDGSVKDITVSDWLKNVDQTPSIEDRSDLSDIKNVKGDEGFAGSGDGSIVWSSGGNDIYYQGKTSKKLPVSVKITYYLDGKEISADELAGKRGKVKIRYEYTNHSTQTVLVDGEAATVATPFAVVTGMILPGENFSNVEVSSGKVISDGSKMIVAGMAFPGLKESLGLEGSELGNSFDLPDYIEVTADVTDFSLDMSATVVTSSIFDEIGIDNVDSIDELENSLNELQNAANELVDGSGQLLDGVSALKDASAELGSGVEALDHGAKSLKDGSQTLAAGIEAYAAGADTLGSGITQYTAGADALAEGTKDYVDGVWQLSQGIDTLAQQTQGLPDAVHKLYEGALAAKSGADALANEQAAAALTEGNQQITEGIGQLHDTIVAIEDSLKASGDDSGSAKASIELAVQTLLLVKSNDSTVLETLESAKGVQNQVDQVKGLAPENIQGAINSLEAQYSSQLDQAIGLLQKNIGMIDGLIESLEGFASDNDMEALLSVLAQMEAATSPENENGLYAGSEALGKGIHTMTEGNKQLKAGIDAVTEGLGQLDEAAKALPEGIGALTEGADALTANNSQLTQGADLLLGSSPALTDGAFELSSQSPALKNGALSLFDGASALAAGTGTLEASVPAMTDGIYQLFDGASQLAGGMSEFNEDGIKKLTDTLEGDVKGLMNRMKAVVDAGKDYQTFTDLADGARGSVKFIIETQGIPASE